MEIDEAKGRKNEEALLKRVEEVLSSEYKGNDIVYLALYMALYYAREKKEQEALKYLEKATRSLQSTPSFNIIDFHELLMDVYWYLGDRSRVEKEFELLKEELLLRKNFKRLEKLERKREEYLK